MDLDRVAQRIVEKGPDRIVVDENGRTMTPDAAAKIPVKAEVVLILDTGWSIGVPWEFVPAAYRPLSDRWVAWLSYSEPPHNPRLDLSVLADYYDERMQAHASENRNPST